MRGGGRLRTHHPLSPTPSPPTSPRRSVDEMRARCQTQSGTAPTAAEASGYHEQGPSKPGRSPRRQGGGLRQDVATQEVVSQQLEQERGVVGIEVGRRDLADAPGALEVADQRLDTGTTIV